MIKIDATQTQRGSAGGIDPEGQSFRTLDGVTLCLVLDATEVADLLEGYDPENDYSPSASESRRIAREICDALRALNL